LTATADLKITIITSSRKENYQSRSHQSGVKDHVVKPVDFQQSVQSIKQIGFSRLSSTNHHREFQGEAIARFYENPDADAGVASQACRIPRVCEKILPSIFTLPR
jgi:response regulator of citrate/malate metabolism